MLNSKLCKFYDLMYGYILNFYEVLYLGSKVLSNILCGWKFMKYYVKLYLKLL